MTDPSDHRYRSPAETAAALGVTVRTLRVYEHKGLVRPHRSAAGWRAYGPDTLARLHQILALKRLGLSLALIGEMLRGRFDALDAVLALQEQALAARRDEADRALVLLAQARTKLAAGQTLSLDDLMTLTLETTMTKQLGATEWSEIFNPLIEKHFTKSEIQAFSARAQPDDDFASGMDKWADLIAEAKRLKAAGAAPTTAGAMDMARRWMALVGEVYGDHPGQAQKGAAMWLEAMTTPATAERLPFDLDLWNYVGAAVVASGAASPS
jgi:MerR family transcriptional regulator, thiopeptide resistance regulator